MIEIKIDADKDFYNAIANKAKENGITIDNFITKAIMMAINLDKSVDFDKKLKDSLERNKEIYKKLADR